MKPELTDRARTVLQAVRKASAGEWVKRQAIAVVMGKNKLSPADVAMLEVLATQGFIEAEERETTAPSGRVFVYRAKDDREDTGYESGINQFDYNIGSGSY